MERGTVVLTAAAAGVSSALLFALLGPWLHARARAARALTKDEPNCASSPLCDHAGSNVSSTAISLSECKALVRSAAAASDK